MNISERRSDLIALSVSIVSAGILALMIAFKPEGDYSVLLAVLGALNLLMIGVSTRIWPRVFNATVGVEAFSTSIGLKLEPNLLRHLTFTTCCQDMTGIVGVMYVVFIIITPIQVYALLKSILS